MVLDGEIVALDTADVPSFSRLQRRWPAEPPTRRGGYRRCYFGEGAGDVCTVAAEQSHGTAVDNRKAALAVVLRFNSEVGELEWRLTQSHQHGRHEGGVCVCSHKWDSR